MWSDRTGAEVMNPRATPVIGGLASSLIHILIVCSDLAAGSGGFNLDLPFNSAATSLRKKFTLE